ncbi:MAG: OmpA family protein [Candidatus Eisenbacteria bacterium]|nr:OmpA family protein [Candidatus Eisenbacteria bacterium]
MNSIASRLVQTLVLTGFVGASGCATKGFVRGELETIRQQMEAEDGRLASEIEILGNSTAEAMARAELALEYAGEAKDLALGRVGYEEVASYTVHFPTDSFDIGGDGLPALEEASGLIQGHPEYIVDIYGFADSSGSVSYNRLLGQKRAESVLRFLAEQSESSLQRFAAVSYGEEKPVGGNAVDNRRVVVSVIARTLGSLEAEPEQKRAEPTDESSEEISQLRP